MAEVKNLVDQSIVLILLELAMSSRLGELLPSHPRHVSPLHKG